MTRCDLGFPAAEAVPVALAKKPGNSRASSSSWDALRIQLSLRLSHLLLLSIVRLVITLTATVPPGLERCFATENLSELDIRYRDNTIRMRLHALPQFSGLHNCNVTQMSICIGSYTLVSACFMHSFFQGSMDHVNT